MNNYKKVSQIPSKELDIITSGENKSLNLLTIGSNLNLSINDSFIYRINTSIITEDAILVGLNQDNLSFTCSIDYNSDSLLQNKWLYFESNNRAPEKKIFFDEKTFTFNTTFFIQKYNNFLIYPIFKNAEGNLLSNNLITSFIIDNQNILTLDINLPSCEICSLTNIDNLQEFSLGKFNAISTFILSNTENILKINLGKLSNQITIIDLGSNKLEYVRLEGANTILTLENCILPLQTLKYIKFVNCLPSNELLLSLQTNNIKIEKTELN